MSIRRRLRGRAVPTPPPAPEPVLPKKGSPRRKNQLQPVDRLQRVDRLVFGDGYIRKGSIVFYPDEDDINLRGTVTGLYIDHSDGLSKVRIKGVKRLINVALIEVVLIEMAESDEDVDYPYEDNSDLMDEEAIPIGREDIDGTPTHVPIVDEPDPDSYWRDYKPPQLRMKLIEASNLLFRVSEYINGQTGILPDLSEWLAENGEREREFDQVRIQEEQAIREEELAELARLKAKYEK